MVSYMNIAVFKTKINKSILTGLFIYLPQSAQRRDFFIKCCVLSVAHGFGEMKAKIIEL